jgi:hypothetical protein
LAPHSQFLVANDVADEITEVTDIISVTTSLFQRKPPNVVRENTSNRSKRRYAGTGLEL